MRDAGKALTSTIATPILPMNLALAAGSGTASSLTNNSKSAVGFPDAADQVRRWCPDVPTDYDGSNGIDVVIYYSLVVGGVALDVVRLTLDYGMVTVGALGTDTQIVNDLNVSAVSSDVLTRVVLGTIPHAAVDTAADLFTMQIGRVGTNGADTFTGTIYIHKIVLEQAT